MEQQRKQKIEGLLRDYANRGEMTRQRFCESRGMTSSALDYYLRRYGKPKSAQEPPRLATVAIAPAAAQSNASFRLVLGNGRSIECGPALRHSRELTHYVVRNIMGHFCRAPKPAELEHLIRVAEAI